MKNMIIRVLAAGYLFCVSFILHCQPFYYNYSANYVLADMYSKIGDCEDMDGMWGCQCVDVAKYVCNTYFGSNITGNAITYQELERWPVGTVKIPYTPGVVPEPGDFFVMNSSPPMATRVWLPVQIKMDFRAWTKIG